jgi:hypothetical protein
MGDKENDGIPRERLEFPSLLTRHGDYEMCDHCRGILTRGRDGFGEPCCQECAAKLMEEMRHD